MFPIARLSFAAAVAVLSLGALGAFHPALAQQLDAGGLSALGAMPVGALVPYLTFAIAVATALLLVLPAPTATSSPIYAAIFNLVHIIANLKTASAPAPAPAPAVSLVQHWKSTWKCSCRPCRPTCARRDHHGRWSRLPWPAWHRGFSSQQVARSPQFRYAGSNRAG